MSRPQLIVFAKAPRPGLVKTRLSPPLTPAQAAWLYEAMLADVLEQSSRFARDRQLEAVLAFAPTDGLVDLLARTPPGFRLHGQRGLGLAERMANAFADCDAAGTEWALLRGSDSPGLGLDHLAEAVSLLESGHDVVLTPDQGGGYAMIGLRAARPVLFELQMSTSDVLGQTLDLARGRGLRVGLTAATFDIDHVTDLARLESLSAEEASDRCPRTVQAVAELRGSGVL